MAGDDNNINDSAHSGDRRLQSLVYELDKKVHALELSDATKALALAHLQGEISGIRSSTASSFEVQAAGKLIGEQISGVKAELESDRKMTAERMGQMSRDLTAMRRVLVWIAATVAAGIIGAMKFGVLFQ